MDHFNTTVQDGALVSTRRGLQVIKTKHHGIRFVNATAISQPSSSSQSREQVNGNVHAGVSKSLPRRFKIVTRPMLSAEGRRGPKKEKSKDAKPTGNPQAEGGISGKRQKTREPTRESADARWLALMALAREDKLDIMITPQLSNEVSRLLTRSWSTPCIDFDLMESQQQLLHLYMHTVPSKLYPNEEILTYNPARTPQFLDSIRYDLVKLHTIVLTASLMDAIYRGERCPDSLAYYISRICAMVNGKLHASPAKIENSTIECIAAMALVATHIGRYDHWHTHVNGLKHVVEVSGGLRKEMGPYLLNKVMRADIKGAAAICCPPYLTYERYCGSATDILSKETKDSLAQTTQQYLGNANVSRVVIDTVTSLVTFIHVFEMARKAPMFSVRLEPDAFIEEWFFILYQIISVPGPLRDQTVSPSDPMFRPLDPSPEPEQATAYRFRHLPNPDNRKSPSRDVLLPAVYPSLLEPGLRLACALYFEAVMPDSPRALNCYDVGLDLLHTQVETINGRLRQRQIQMALGCLASDMEANDGLPSHSALRPILIWVCLVGYATSIVADNEIMLFKVEHRRGAYRDCLSLLVGPTPEDAVRLKDADLAFCRLLDPSGVKARTPADPREFIKRVLCERARSLADANGVEELGAVSPIDLE